MPAHSEKRTLPYTPDQLFDLSAARQKAQPHLDVDVIIGLCACLVSYLVLIQGFHEPEILRLF